MGAVFARVRAEVRSRWLAWLALALLAGLGAGVVLTLLAGARRTEQAYPEFSRAQRAADVLVAGKSSFGLIGSVDLDDVEQLPQVADSARSSVSVLFGGATDSGRSISAVDVFPVAPDDNRLGRSIERWKMLEGRRADPAKVDEATASFVLADRLNLHVGSTLRLHFVKADSFGPVAATLLDQFGPRLIGAPGAEATTIDRLADGPNITFRIVGIEASPAEFPPLGPDLSPALHLTPAFTKAHGSDVVSSPLSYVRLERPSLIDAFAKGVERLAPGEPVAFIVSRPFQTTKVQRSIDVQATALRLLAALTLFALVVIVAQTLVRQAFVESNEDQVYRALGMSSRQIVGVAAIAGGLIGVTAAVIAVLTAFFASPLMPIGLARKAEVHSGLDFDPLVLGLGAVAIVVAITLLALLAELRVAQVRRRTHRVARRPIVDRVLGSVVLPPTPSVGARFALDSGRGADGVPVWTAVLGAALAFVLLAGTWTYRASLQTLLDTPSLYGWNWSVKSGAPALPEIGTTLIPAFATDPAVEAFAAGTVTQADIGGERVDVLAMDQQLGNVAPTVLEGRLPKNDNEVLLGTKTLEAADAELGETLVLRIGGTSVPMTAVGRGVFPEYGDAGRLGYGAFTTYGGVQRVLPDARRNLFLLRFTPEANRRDTLVRFRDALQPVPTRASGRPRDLQDLARVRGLPLVMAVILSLLAAATLAHALVTSVRRRRRDLAVLKTVGFRRRQVALAVAWQASILVGLSLAIGLPLGVLGGQAAWNAFAEGLGTEPDPTVPVALILLTIPVAIVFGNLIAAVPAWVAGRTRPARILRGE